MSGSIFHPARDHDAGPGKWCVRSTRSPFELKFGGKVEAHIIAAILNGEPVPKDLIALLRNSEESQYQSELKRPRAPWTDEEVKRLNQFQASPETFALKCDCYRDDEAHQTYAEQHGGVPGQLIAVQEGWHCPVCSYKQDWAHPIMLKADWGPPFWYFMAPDYSGTDGN